MHECFMGDIVAFSCDQLFNLSLQKIIWAFILCRSESTSIFLGELDICVPSYEKTWRMRTNPRIKPGARGAQWEGMSGQTVTVPWLDITLSVKNRYSHGKEPKQNIQKKKNSKSPQMYDASNEKFPKLKKPVNKSNTYINKLL